MRKWAKSWESLLKAEVNMGKILESASKYKHAEARGSTRKHAEARDHDLSNFLLAVQKSVAHFEGGDGGCIKAIQWTACRCQKVESRRKYC